MNIYDNWKKMRIHILFVTFVAVIVGAAAVIFSGGSEEWLYFSYILNSITATISCIIFSVKNGFKWWYPTSVLFVETMTLVVCFLNTQLDMIPFMFVSYLSVSFVSTAMGTIIGKIKRNNEE